MEYNIYCQTIVDIDKTKEPILVLGALLSPNGNVIDFAKHLDEIKRRNLKVPINDFSWQRVAEGNRQNYMSLVKWFFRRENLHFKALIVPARAMPEGLSTKLYEQEFFYERFDQLFSSSLKPGNKYNIYVSIADPALRGKVSNLKNVLLKNFKGPELPPWIVVKDVNYHYFQLLQVADVLTGALSYSFRGLTANLAKHDVVTLMRLQTGQTLLKNSSDSETKLSVTIWEDKERG